MQLDNVEGMDADAKGKLESAGVKTAADLARLQEGAPVDGVDQPRVDALREAARAHIIGRFREAGAPDETALAEADPAALAEKTGLPVGDVEWFQAAAREELERGASASKGRVVLREGSGRAQVVLGDVTFERVGIVTARKDEPGEPKLAALEGNVVLLQEGATAAVARLSGKRHELPIFKAEDSKEIRVKIEGIRGPKDSGGGLLSKFRKK